jgi:hypothetical protein
MEKPCAPSFTLHQVYEVDFTGQVQFGNIPIDILHKIYQDGRAAAKLLEHDIAIRFPELKYIDTKGYDFIDANNQKYDAKCFTKYGLNFAPPSMTGTQRKIDFEQIKINVPQLIYICCDVTQFPLVKMVFIPGQELLDKFEKCKIRPNQKRFLFG